MTVRAQHREVRCHIEPHRNTFLEGAQGTKVMSLNEADSQLAIAFGEVKPTALAHRTVMPLGLSARSVMPLNSSMHCISPHLQQFSS